MTQIWMPGVKARTEQRLPPEYLRMLAVLAETSGDIRIGLHCADCDQDIVGKNARADNHWIMECACRTFIGGNPLPKVN